MARKKKKTIEQDEVIKSLLEFCKMAEQLDREEREELLARQKSDNKLGDATQLQLRLGTQSNQKDNDGS